MKYRDRVICNGTLDVFKPMSPAKFKERYGITFKEWKETLAKNDVRQKLKFDECYCDDDPYAADVNGEIAPIIEGTAEQLRQSCIDAAYEV